MIEAGRRSGSLITAQCALEQGRDVFTLPAVLGNPAYEGNHWLLQQGAYIATAPADITDHLALDMQWLALPPVTEAPEVIITPVQEELPFAHVLINVDDEPTPADIIAARCELPVTEVTTQLLQLELSGKIAVVSGDISACITERYRRKVKLSCQNQRRNAVRNAAESWLSVMVPTGLFGCSAYPECDYIRPLKAGTDGHIIKVLDGQLCPQCGGTLVLRRALRDVYRLRKFSGM